jgi:polyisoprenoid-binding protein YceI
MKSKILWAGTLFMAVLLSDGNWNIDTEAAKINFSVKGPFGTVHGSFSGLKATIQFNEKDLAASSVSASVSAKTVSTGIGMRNHDLRSEEKWLNTDKYAEISFRSKKIEKTDKGYKANGELTLKGVTKAIEIPFTFAANGSSGVFKGTFTINREDFNVGKKGGSVGSIITINLEVPVKK